MLKADWVDDDEFDASDANDVATAVNALTIAASPVQSSFYNVKSTNTRQLRSSLGKAVYGTQHWVGLGDSIMAGYMGTLASPAWDPTHSYLRVMSSALATLGVPVGGTGLVPVTSDVFAGPTDTRWTMSSGWIVTSGAGTMGTFTNTATATFVSDVSGTQVDVYCLGDTGSATVNVDGLGAQAITMGAGVKKYTRTGLANTVHTVVVTSTSTGAFTLIGASVTNSTGLVVHNVAMGGSKSGDWTSTSAGTLNTTRLGQLPTPAVVFIELGGNDHLQSVTGATFKTNITTLRNQFPNSDCVLVQIPTWNYFQTEMYALADSLDCPLVDWFDRYGGTTIGTANGLVTDVSGIHFNQAFHADAGRSLAQLLAS